MVEVLWLSRRGVCACVCALRFCRSRPVLFLFVCIDRVPCNTASLVMIVWRGVCGVCVRLRLIWRYHTVQCNRSALSIQIHSRAHRHMQKWNTLDTIWTCTPRAVFGLIRDAQVERDIPGGMAHICNVDLSRRGISLQMLGRDLSFRSQNWRRAGKMPKIGRGRPLLAGRAQTSLHFTWKVDC